MHSDTQPPSCQNCGDSKADGSPPLYRFNNLPSAAQGRPFFLKRCPTCGVVSTFPVTAETLEKAYSSDYYGTGAAKFMAGIEYLLRKAAGLKAQQLQRFVAGDTPAPRTALDIGCGRGLLLSQLKNLDFEVTGLERNRYPVTDATAKYVHVGSITDSIIATKKYDLIILWHVLEHLQGTDDLLSACCDMLAARGTIAIAVPNFASFQRRIFGSNWFHLDVPRHVTHLEAQWLIDSLTAKGMKLKAASHLDLIQNTYGFIQSALNTLTPNQTNYLYSCLTSGRCKTRDAPKILVHAALAVLILPVAILELIVSATLKQGATVQIIGWKNRD